MLSLGRDELGDDAVTKNILIVDDEPKVAILLKESLESAGHDYTVSQVQSAEAALSALAIAPYDLVVTDVRMPGMNGLDLLNQVRRDQPNLPTILITAYDSEDVAAASRRLQTSRYFIKPFKVEEFVTAVQEVLTTVENGAPSLPDLSPRRVERLTVRLHDLRYETGASKVCLISSTGQVLIEIGLTDGIDVAELAGQLRASFEAPQAIARAWHEARAFNLIYHEGVRFDLYAANVDPVWAVAMMFDRRLGPNRLGVVWLYLKRALIEMDYILTHD